MSDDNGITLVEAKNCLAEAISARSALLGGAKSYRYSNGGTERQVTQEDLKAITDDLIYWETRVRRLASGGVRARGVTFLC